MRLFGGRRREPGGMVRETFKHAAIYSGAGMLGRLISFFMLPFYAHILRDVGYGVIGMIDASITLLASLFAYSFHTAVMRIYHEERDPARKPKVATTGTLLVAGIVLSLVLVAAAFSRPASNLLLGTPQYWDLICLALATFCLDMVGHTAQTVLIIQRRSVTYSLIGLLRLILGVGLNIVLVVILRWDLLGFFLSGLVVALVSMCISLVLLVKICGFGYDGELARRLLSYQLPLVPGGIATFFSKQAERVIVRFQIDLATLGVLEMGYKFPSLISLLVVGPFLQSWSTKRLEIADEPQAAQRIGQVFTYYLYLCLLVGLLLTVNIRTVLQLLTPAEFWDAFSIARIQTLQVIVHGAGMHLTFGLIYAKRTGIMARLAILTSAFKVGLSYVMISAWGLFGAAWSSLIAASIYTIWGHFLARRHFRIQLEWHKLLLIMGSALALFAAIDTLESTTIAARGAPIVDAARTGLESLRDTWLGTWKDGKLLRLLGERGDLVLDFVVRSLLVALYLVILPLVHSETRNRLMGKFDKMRSKT